MKLPPGALTLAEQAAVKAQKGTKRLRRPEAKERFADCVVGMVPPGKTVVDIGAGWGFYAARLAKAGVQALAFDGTPGIERLTNGLVRWIDLARPCPERYGCADWGICFDVGEHIIRRHERTVLDNIAGMPREVLLVGWSPIGDCWGKHVNPRGPEWVVRKLGFRGWREDPPLTAAMRVHRYRYYYLGFRRF